MGIISVCHSETQGNSSQVLLTGCSKCCQLILGGSLCVMKPMTNLERDVRSNAEVPQPTCDWPRQERRKEVAHSINFFSLQCLDLQACLVLLHPLLHFADNMFFYKLKVCDSPPLSDDGQYFLVTKFFFKPLAVLSLLTILFFCQVCLFVQGCTCGIGKFPGQGLNQSCHRWPAPQPQQCQIQATVHGDARSLTH